MKKTIICAAFTVAGAIFLGLSALGINIVGCDLQNYGILLAIMFFVGLFMFLVGFISGLKELLYKEQ